MRNVIVFVIASVFVVYAAVQGSTAYKARTELADRVEYHLDFVDASSMASVKQDIVHDARKSGIDLRPTDIRILFEDSEQRTVAQQIVGKRLGAQFTNKRIAISVHYAMRILGLPFTQDITRSKIKQVEAPRMPYPAAQQQLLDKGE